MISTAIDTCLETLAGYIFDDDKLVTYKWLSKELGLHVNLAKQILWQFLNEHSKRKEVLATFILMGYIVDDVYRVEVVKESDLSFAKEKFRKLSSEHVYSLQRDLPDLETLALSGHGDLRQAAIVCKEIIPREEGELAKLRWGSRLGDSKTTAKSAEKTWNTNSKSKPNTEKNSLRNIFGKANEGKNGPSKSPTLDIPKEAAAARGQKRRGSSDREVISIKKQKRKFDTDSRSSDESGDNDEEEPEIGSGPEEVAPAGNIARPSASPPKYKMEKGKRMVRKIVDKTSTDENGYLVTRKEYVYESNSDTEELTAEKLIEAPKPQAAVSKSNRKQASLLNFFKKS